MKVSSRIHLHLSNYYTEEHEPEKALSHQKHHLELEQASQRTASEQRSAVLLLEQEYEVQAAGGLLAETTPDRFQTVKRDVGAFRKQRGKAISTDLLDLPGFQNALKQAFQASRDENQPLALALLELGEVPGPDAPASLLKAVTVMQRTMPPRAVFGLLKGHVLAVLLPDTSPRRAWTLCEGWRHALEDRSAGGLGGLQTIHLGLCTQTAWSRAEDMLSCADRLLYQAKCLGPGQLLSDWKA
ncbi:hypothetical protein [Deinococcus ruber]|uniref:GGDEF domain-containing protein n=1 Tax=Deinococcus ruber TaxID=1848197 RepID=A0A918C1Z4_9DEIO|nr:hypothetical protein [Deinococcus ruber]GGR03063.1 hypothetical protein GCM10008957_14880 [Deinococcus ruber]